MSDDIATAERVALHIPHAQRAEAARRLLDTPAAQEDPMLVRTFSEGFVVPGHLFDQAYPEPDDEGREPAVLSPAHPAGKGRDKGKAAAEGKGDQA